MYWREINAITANGSSPRFWPKGREILQHIQDRKTTEQKMKRVKDPLVASTATPESNGNRKKSKHRWIQ